MPVKIGWAGATTSIMGPTRLLTVAVLTQNQRLFRTKYADRLIMGVVMPLHWPISVASVL